MSPPRVYTVYHLWDRWHLNMSGSVTVLEVDEPREILFYSGVRKVYKNKGCVSVVFKRADGAEQIVLLNPLLESETGFNVQATEGER